MVVGHGQIKQLAWIPQYTISDLRHPLRKPSQMTEKPEHSHDTTADKPAPKLYKDPGPQKQPPPAGEDPNKPDPTRYGDWEINGRCIDF